MSVCKRFVSLLFISLIIATLIPQNQTVIMNGYPDFNSEVQRCCLFVVKGSVLVQAPTTSAGPFKLYLHIPVSYDNQTPFFIQLTDETGGKIDSFRIMDNYPGSNALLEVSFDNLETTDILSFYWTSSVILKYNDYQDLPESLEKTDIQDLPDEIQQYVASTEFVQTNHPDIIAEAQKIADNQTDVLDIAVNIANYTRNNITVLTDGPQDALSTLNRGSANCVGKANLATAFLRALGIPARSIMEGPSPHFLAEFYAYPYGWVRLESTAGVTPLEYFRNIITYYATPEDEYSTNTVNGVHPSEGYVWYYGKTNPEILWGLDLDSSKHSVSIADTTLEIFNNVLNLSKEVWGQQIRCLELGLTDDGNELYNQATSAQGDAVDHFKAGRFTEFVSSLEDSYEVYLQIDENATNSIPGVDNSYFLSTRLVVSIILSILPLFLMVYLKKRRN